MEKSLLNRINSPADLKKLPIEKLSDLAAELRQEIIETVSHTGGHLASNLGVVELTIALNYVFDFLTDRIVWDVGHQAYGHKLLTGRRERFHTIRQYKGLSGFPKREESHYDHFGTGHAGTAISAALGMAVKRDLAKENHYVVAVVGDGSLTAGLSLEGLNQAGHLDRNMIIILNNNDMSIAPNVGAMSGYLNKIIHGRALNKLRMDTELALKQIPTIGPGLIKFARTIEHAIKRTFIPGTLFEELGLKYVGPLDGHDTEKMINELNRVKELDGPVLFHINTIKGKGYPIAELNPADWHGASTFDIKTGASLEKINGKPKAPAYTDVFAKTLIRLMDHDAKIVAITAAMPNGTGLDKVAEKYPERVFDVGIAEQFAVTFAGGLASQGYKPVVAIYSTFMMRAYDQVFHDICLQDLPVLLALDRAGLVGADGPTHHGMYDIAYLRCLPNIILMAPMDEIELYKMMHTAMNCKHPAAIRYPRDSSFGKELPLTCRTIKIGKAEVLKDGSDAAIFTCGTITSTALEIAQELEQKHLEISVVNSRFIKPIDHEIILEKALSTGCLITIEEGILNGGFGSAVQEVLEERGFQGKVNLLRLGLPDAIIPHGSREQLFREVGFDKESLKTKITGFIKANQKQR